METERMGNLDIKCFQFLSFHDFENRNEFNHYNSVDAWQVAKIYQFQAYIYNQGQFIRLYALFDSGKKNPSLIVHVSLYKISIGFIFIKKN